MTDMDTAVVPVPGHRAPAPTTYFITSTRFVMALMFLGAMMVKDMMSSNLAMAMVCLVNNTATGAGNSSASNKSACRIPDVYTNEAATYHGSLQWNSGMQGLIFSAFDWGLALIVFMGFLADKLSPKRLLIFCIILSVVATTLTPITAIHSFPGTVFLRVILGFCNAVLNPAVNTMIAMWFPMNERNTAYAVASCGDQISTIIILPISGVFCGLRNLLKNKSCFNRVFEFKISCFQISSKVASDIYKQDISCFQTGHIVFSKTGTRCIFLRRFLNWAHHDGWQLIFYFTAGIAVIYLLIWIGYGTETPNSHRFISNSERCYIEAQVKDEKTVSEGKRISKKIPWRWLLSSPAVWATVIGTIGHEFPLIILSLYMPTYLKDVLAYSVDENGWLSAAPKIAFLLVKLASSYFSDYLQQRCGVSKTILAKVFNSIGCLGLGTFLLGTTFLNCSNRTWSTVFLILSQALAGCHVPGSLGTLVSVAPAYTGTICGIAYSLVAILSIIGPNVVGAVVTDGTREEWNIIFYAMVVVIYLPLLVFNVWGTADVQWWAKPGNEGVPIYTGVTGTSPSEDITDKRTI